jgi:hypothetical protein
VVARRRQADAGLIPLGDHVVHVDVQVGRGRATIERLRMNQTDMIVVRRLLAQLGIKSA